MSDEHGFDVTLDLQNGHRFLVDLDHGSFVMRRGSAWQDSVAARRLCASFHVDIRRDPLDARLAGALRRRRLSTGDVLREAWSTGALTR